ncbi:hypothetical protein BIW11_02433 [Tropilaelaps mercedesae]|uniref:Uncharacterized protein n=1 Tax=Tropilaelaps mercedesae TaxID=418985 RepID=A0A1V9Y397_9ACAR|nr:hypothetical protein BIW11_02433 [Tropilaelaps mercedesae]
MTTMMPQLRPAGKPTPENVKSATLEVQLRLVAVDRENLLEQPESPKVVPPAAVEIMVTIEVPTVPTRHQRHSMKRKPWSSFLRLRKITSENLRQCSIHMKR